ncbi:MAG: tail fiber domain-containing protein [Patescibacteria group bacterium]|nr:tail fiber domain-containing protein [Patescibacteria group bacterium]
MKKQIFSSKIIYFSIFLIFICFSFWGIKNVGAKTTNFDTTIDGINFLKSGGGEITNLTIGAGIGSNAATIDYVKSSVLGTGTSAVGLWMDGTTYIYPTNVPANSFVILDTGNVGIGSSAPSQPLQVVANSSQRGVGIMTYSPTSAGSASLDFYTQANRALGSQIVGWNTNTGELGIYTNAGATLGLYQNATGYVGIGITIPGYKFDVWDSGTTAISRINNDSATRRYTGLRLDRQASEKWFVGLNDTTGSDNLVFRRAGTTDDMVINTSGYIGIGTTIPSNPLHIKSTSSPQLKIEYDAGRYAVISHDGSITNNDNTGANPIIFTTGGSGVGDHDIVFVPEGAEAMRIKAGGYVGIGTTIPAGILHTAVADGMVYWDTYSSTAANRIQMVFRKSASNTIGSMSQTATSEELGGVEFKGVDNGNNSDWGAVIQATQDGASGTKVPTNLFLYTSGSSALNTNQLVLHNDGNVGIGTSSPNKKLHVYNTSVNAEIDIQSVAGANKHWAIYHDSGTDSLRFWNNSVEGVTDGDLLTLSNDEVVGQETQDGMVGIGTTAPTHRLEVISDVHGSADDLVPGVFASPAGYFNNIHPSMSTGLYGEGLTRGVWGHSRAANMSGYGVLGTMGSDDGMCYMTGGSGGAVVGWAKGCTQGNSVAIRAILPENVSGYGIYSQGEDSKNYFEGPIGIGTTDPGIKLAIGDTDTGLDWESDGNLKIMTNNSERIRIASDGKVGIGTTNPAAQLTIGSQGQTQAATNSGYILLSVPDASNGPEAVNGIEMTSNYSGYATKFYTNNSGDYFGIATRYNSAAWTQRLVIKEQTGNVGIGTTSPASPLDVRGNGGAIALNTAARGVFSSTMTAASGGYLFGGGATDVVPLLVASENASAINVGGGIGFAGKYNSASNTVVTWAGILGAKENSTDSNDSGYLAFGTRATGDYIKERMRIASTGNVGIGTTNPTTKLHLINGDNATAFTRATIALGWSTTGQYSNFIHTRHNGSGAANNAIDFYTSDGTASGVFPTNAVLGLTINNGQVGVGQTTPGQALDVTGTIRQSTCKTAGTLSANTSGDIICTSDERLKNIYGYYQGGLAALSAINPIRFSYKGEDFVHVGFSAQNVKSVLPEASALQDSGYWSLDDTSITALTVNAIKEQQKEITALAGQVEDLKNIVCQLKPDADVCKK